MSNKARVAVLPMGQTRINIEELNLPDPGPSQVIVKQFASGICHSQLHQIHRKNRMRHLVLGHESTGVVIKTGRDVDYVREGDSVMISWVPRNIGQKKIAPIISQLDVSVGHAFSENVFTWADQTLVDEQYVLKINPKSKMDVLSIVGCAVITGAGAVVNTAAVKEGDTVAVFGAGGVGLCAIAAARKVGAARIIVVDISDEKLSFAEKFGATHFVNASREDPVETIRSLTEQRDKLTFQRAPITGADYVFDCIGIKKTMEQLIPSCRTGQFGVCRGGTAVLVGVPQESFEIPAPAVLVSEKSFIGSFAGSCIPERDIPRFIKWHEEGHLDLDALVTARYSLDQINEAVTALSSGQITGRAIIEF